MPEKIEDEVVDFSNFSNNPAPAAEQPQDLISPIQPLPSNPIVIPKRILILVAVLVLLSVAQMIIFLLSRPRKIEVPKGYQIVQPANGPIRMEKIP